MIYICLALTRGVPPIDGHANMSISRIDTFEILHISSYENENNTVWLIATAME